MNFRAIFREPALLLDVAETLLVMLIAFGLPVSGDQQTYVVAALIAVVGAVKAFSTRPWAVPAIMDAGRALLVVLASFGVGLSSNQIVVIATALGSILTLIARAQITPGNSPVAAPAGAGAGPVDGLPGNDNPNGRLWDHRGAVDVVTVLVVAVLVVLVLFLVGVLR